MAARLPSLLAALGTLAAVLALGRSFPRRFAGLAGASILLSSPQFANLATSARLDSLLTFFTTAALLCFWRLDRGIGRPRPSRIGFHLALALGLLTKGPVALALPLAGIVAYLAVERRTADLRRVVSLRSLGLVCTPLVLWTGLAAAASGDPLAYLRVGVWENVVGRSLQGSHHLETPLFYLRKLPESFLPYTLLWIPAAFVGWRVVTTEPADSERRRLWILLLCAVFAPLLVLSASTGKRLVYALPLYPVASLLCADAGLEAFARLSRRHAGWGTAITGACAALLALAGALLVTGILPPPRGVTGIERFGLGVIAVAGLGALVPAALRRVCEPGGARFGGLLVTMGMLELLAAVQLLPAYRAAKGHRLLALAARSAAGDGAIGLVSRSKQLRSELGYYAGGEILLFDQPGEGLRFLTKGGRALVVSESILPRLEETGAVRPLARPQNGAALVGPVAAGPRDPEASR